MGFVVGTAGHIDHGKSTLVEALTGIHPDRLVQEKMRGITIELGFGQVTLSEEVTIDLVDVPGHEALIRTMVAGASGVDGVLLVVAADEGVMPQTVEHLEILGLLGITKGVVALTKIDRVDDELVELARLELEETLATTSLAHAPIIGVSAPQGLGLDALRAALLDLIRQSHAHTALRPFMLPVDRVFSKRGFGTVVTGSTRGGQVKVGDKLQVYPTEKVVRVRGLQCHGIPVEEIGASHRVAVNLSGVDAADLGRGQVLAPQGAIVSTSIFDALVQVLPSARAIKKGCLVQILTGTTEVEGRIDWISQTGDLPLQVEGGTTIWAQVRTATPLPMVAGQSFIFRRTTPDRTVGGGVVLDPSAPRLRTRNLQQRRTFLETLTEFQRDPHMELSATVARLLQSSSKPVLLATELQSKLGIMLPSNIPEHEDVISLPDHRYTHKTSIERWGSQLIQLLSTLHDEAPLRAAFPASDLSHRLHVDESVLRNIVQDVEGQVEWTSDGIRLAGRERLLDGEQQQLLGQVVNVVLDAGLESVDPLGVLKGRADGDQLLGVLVAQGSLIRIHGSYVLHPDVHQELVDRVRSYLEEHGAIEPTQFKELTGLSRKRAIPLLEHLDTIGLTRRRGNQRVLRE